jgi:hypothetical protein
VTELSGFVKPFPLESVPPRPILVKGKGRLLRRVQDQRPIAYNPLTDVREVFQHVKSPKQAHALNECTNLLVANEASGLATDSLNGDGVALATECDLRFHGVIEA